MLVKNGDEYKHFKGGDYTFLGISIPLLDPYIQFKKEDLSVSGKAILEETQEEIILYDYFGLHNAGSGLIFTDLEIPYVIYQSDETGVIWARPVDGYFGYKKKENNVLVKRFTLKN